MNPFDLVKNLKDIQGQMSQMKDEMQKISVTGSAGGNMVLVTMYGEFQMTSIKIDPIAVDPRDVKMLEDIIVAAHFDAMSKVKEKLQEKSVSLMNGMDLSKFGM